MQPLNIAHLYNVCYNLVDNGYNKGVYNMSVLDYPFDSAYILQKKKSIKKELNGIYWDPETTLASSSFCSGLKYVILIFS